MIKICGKATKKPVEIHWFKWKQYGNIRELKSWIESFGDSFDKIIDVSENNIKVLTLEGSSYNVPDGYIIIRGIKGEYYPCESEIFKQTYNTI